MEEVLYRNGGTSISSILKTYKSLLFVLLQLCHPLGTTINIVKMEVLNQTVPKGQSTVQQIKVDGNGFKPVEKFLLSPSAYFQPVVQVSPSLH